MNFHTEFKLSTSITPEQTEKRKEDYSCCLHNCNYYDFLNKTTKFIVA